MDTTKLTLTLAVLAAPFSSVAAVPGCDARKTAEILAPASREQPSVQIDCNLSLPPKSLVTKQLLLSGRKASGITVDCNGATLRSTADNRPTLRILVSSAKTTREDGTTQWIPPQDITIKNCRIEGPVRIQGMAINGEDASLTASSRQAGHTERVQAAAPSGISLLNNDFVASGQIPLYFSPGVHHARLENSRFSGYSYSIAFYLDAESAYNTIKNNTFNVETRRQDTLTNKALIALHQLDNWFDTDLVKGSQSYREQIAVDGSAHNLFAGNRFNRLEHGGIYLYRNCGEGGNIRHQTPTGNRIVNNVFYYRNFDGSVPAVWLGSRKGDRSYCDLDKGYPFGSSASDLDHADGNAVTQNQFYKFAPGKMIRDGGRGNYLAGNATVTRQIKRKSGCYLADASPNLLAHGQAIRQTRHDAPAACIVEVLSCDDGEIRVAEQPCPSAP